MRHFRNFINTYLDYTSGHEGTPRVHKWSIISVLASACERRLWLSRGFYTLYPNLYVFIIGRSGLIKKSTSTGIAVNLLREIPNFRIMSERLTASSLIEQLRLAGGRFEYQGSYVKQSPLFAYASELSVFLSEVFGSITELLTTFYDCTPHDSTKPWSYQTIGRGDVKIYGPCLNILGASTKTWLQKCIPKTEMEGGFTSRIIFVVENKIPDKLVAWPESTIELETTRLKLIEDLKHIHELKGEFSVTQEAKDLFKDWYEYHMKEVVPLNQDPRMVGYMARKGDTILKLSMIHSVATNDNLVIGKEDMKWASREIDDLEKDWRMAFDGLSEKRVDQLPYELRNFIRTKVKVSKTELMDTYAPQYPATEIAKALKDLLDMHEISEGEHDEGGVKIGYFSFEGSDLAVK